MMKYAEEYERLLRRFIKEIKRNGKFGMNFKTSMEVHLGYRLQPFYLTELNILWVNLLAKKILENTIIESFYELLKKHDSLDEFIDTLCNNKQYLFDGDIAINKEKSKVIYLYFHRTSPNNYIPLLFYKFNTTTLKWYDIHKEWSQQYNKMIMKITREIFKCETYE